MAVDWQNGFEAVLDERTALADTYIKMTPVPAPSEGRLVLEDTSKTNYEVIYYTSKDASGVYIGEDGARNEDGNSDGIHPKGARIRMNITAQDMREIRDYSLNIVENSGLPEVNSDDTASSVTPASSNDVIEITALAGNLTINAPSGTPYNGKMLLFRILATGSNRTLTWDSAYRALGVDIPTSAPTGKWVYVGASYNETADKWDVIAATTQE